jgi:hypothetical protein
MASSCPVIDDFAKDYLHGQLRPTRQALVWKLDGLSEYDVQRPLTATGTIFSAWSNTWRPGRPGTSVRFSTAPFPEPLPRWQDADGSDLWVTQDETREQIIGFYQRAWDHADATIKELPIDALGHVPWWPRPDVKLFNMIVHVSQDTTRHAGHADILREQLDGRTGVTAEYEEQIDTAVFEARRAKIERAVQAAAGGSGHAGLSDAPGAVGTAP